MQDKKQKSQEPEKDRLPAKNPTEQTPDAASYNHQPPETEDRNTEKASKSVSANTHKADSKPKRSVPLLDYASMSMEKLLSELQRLTKQEDIQATSKPINAIKQVFDQKFRVLVVQRKEAFIAEGGDEIDFRYNDITKKQFDETFAAYREKRDQYYQQREQMLKNNLQKRLDLIAQLKGLMEVEENIHNTYITFKAIQDDWRKVGPVPKARQKDLWRTYHHHVEIFYDFLQLNRELRDLDFKHNLEEKQKLIVRAEALAHETDLYKAFIELQLLHKIWKEELGPVAKEQREAIWERFSTATKALHQRRREHFQAMEKVYEKNLEKKLEIIAKLETLANTVSDQRKTIRQQATQVEILRKDFISAGKVPQKDKEQTWNAFREAVRKFNHGKNTFYKAQKKEQQHNLEKKKALIALALSLKDSEDWETATPEMKRIQNEWKTIGFVPKKEADPLWETFKDACNHYFERLHNHNDQDQKEAYQNLKQKKDCLERLKDLQLTGNSEEDLKVLKTFLAEWKQYGDVPYHKKHINAKFDKVANALFKKIGISPQQSALLKYGDKLQRLTNEDNTQAISKEKTFIKRKIEESKAEVRQLENNLQFFSNTSENNPLIKKVIQNIEKQKEILEIWKAKLKKLNNLK